MVQFKSIIVLDLETTSLPQNDHNTTKITELAMIGCEVEHLKNSKELPRVLHKLVLPFNPNKPIHFRAADVTGLSNDLLSNVKPFRKEDVEILRHFIDRLPPPVCLIAHNGMKFDFPILRRALHHLNLDLQNNVYCADSLKAFQQLLPKPSLARNKGTTTPTNQKSEPFNEKPQKRVARELFPDDEALSQWSVTMEDEIASQCPKSYALGNIYEFLFKGKFQDQHRAEGDSQALLSCIMVREDFLKWIENSENTVIFNSVEPLA